MPGLSKVIVLDADVRASRQVQLGFERESVPTVVIPADGAHALPAEDAGLVVIGGADGQALELVRHTRAWRDARHLDAPILFASRGVRRTDAEAAGADEVVLQPAFLRDIVTLGRMLRGLRAEQRTRLVGSLVDVAGVFPLVRALAGLGRSATLTLIRGLRRGEIRFYHGEVTSAQVGMIHGQAALHQLLLWTDARFDFHHEEVVRRQQIPLSHDELFADAERFLESVRDASGGLSPAIVLEQDVERLQALGKQIPTQVYGVLRLFDGYRVLADALEDSPYRVFETLRVAQRAVEAGLLRVVDKEPPRPTWRAILGIEEWLVGGEPPASTADGDADPVADPIADSAPVATQPAARITERGPSMDTRKTARKPRRKKKRREATPQVARTASPAAAPPAPAAPAAPPAPHAAIDWGALVPRVVGAEVGSLAGAVPAAHVSGEIVASASRANAAAGDLQPTVVLDDDTEDARETPHVLAATLPDAVAHLAPPSSIGAAVAPHDIAHFAPPSGLGPAVAPHDIAHFAPPSGLGPAVAPHDIAHFAPPSDLGPDDPELAPIPRVRRGPGALDRSRRETSADDRGAEVTDPEGPSPFDEAAWAAHALVRATAEAVARAEATLGERRAAQRLATEVAAVATIDAEAKSDAATRARADAAARAEQAALAQAAAAERREAERLALEAAARAEADARASADAAAAAEADARARAEAAAQAAAAARASADAAAQAEAEARAKAEAAARAEADARASADAAVQADADARAKLEAAAQATAVARASANAAAQADADARARADAAAQADADARAMASAAAQADADAHARAQAATQTEAEARAMADVAARAEADARARSAEAARVEADARAKSEAAARADVEAQARAAAAAQADADARVIAELAAAAEAIAREQREAEHLAAEAAARADSELRALTDAMARAEADARAATEALALAAADAFGDAMDRTHTDAGALPPDDASSSEHRRTARTAVAADLRLADTKPERTTPRPRPNSPGGITVAESPVASVVVRDVMTVEGRSANTALITATPSASVVAHEVVPVETSDAHTAPITLPPSAQATASPPASSAANQTGSPPQSSIPTEPMSVPADPLIAAVYDAEIESDEDEPVTSPGFAAARRTIRGVAAPRVGDPTAAAGPATAARDTGERDLEERDTKPFTAQPRPTDERDTTPLPAHGPAPRDAHARPTDERGIKPLPAHGPVRGDAHAHPADERGIKPPPHGLGPRDTHAPPTDERDTRPLPAHGPRDTHVRPTDERDTKPLPAQARRTEERGTKPDLEARDAPHPTERELGSSLATERGVAAHRPTERGVVAPRITQPEMEAPDGVRPTADPRQPADARHDASRRGVHVIGANRATERGFAAAPGSTAEPDELSPFDGNTPVDSTPSAILDEPSDGIVRQHITTADTAPVKRRRLPSDPPEDDRPGAAMGEITASTRATAEPRYSEPSILVADLFADNPAVPGAVTDAASNQATAPVAQSSPIASAPAKASEPAPGSAHATPDTPGHASAGHTSAGHASADHASAGHAPVGHVPTGPMRIDHGPTGPMPINHGPTGPMPINHGPTGPMPVGHAPTGPMPVGHAPTGPMPVGHAPTGPMPVGHAPTGPMPVGHAPTGPTPLGHAPTGPTPVGHVPSGPAPVGHAPTGPTPVGHGPTGDGLIGSAPMDRAPVGDDPDPLAQASDPGPHAPGSTAAAVGTHAKRPQTQRSGRAAQEAGQRREKRPSEPRREPVAFSEAEEAFFRAGHDKDAPAAAAPRPESFDDLDEGYRPVGFWDRLRGRSARRRRKSTGPVNASEPSKPTKPVKR